MDVWKKRVFTIHNRCRNTINSEATLWETTNQYVTTTTKNDDIRPSTSRIRSSSTPSKTLKSIPDYFSSDDNVFLHKISHSTSPTVANRTETISLEQSVTRKDQNHSFLVFKVLPLCSWIEQLKA